MRSSRAKAALRGALFVVALATSACAHDTTATRDGATDAPRDNYVRLDQEAAHSPFRAETVLKLNAITARSLAAIDAFDQSIAETRRLVDDALANQGARDAATVALGRLDALGREATAAHRAMTAADAAIRASGEPFDEIILAAIVEFVARVDSDIAEEHGLLAAKLNVTP